MIGMTKIISSSHDNHFLSLMSNVHYATAFFKTYLPAHLQKDIDFSTLRLYPDGRRHPHKHHPLETDILYEVKYCHRDAFLFFHVEHESTPKRYMPLRFLEYGTCIWSEYAEEHHPEKLPVIIPILYYVGKRPFCYSLDLRDLIDGARQLVERCVMGPAILIDVAAMSEEELNQPSLIALNNCLMKHIRDKQFAVHLHDFLMRCKPFLSKETQHFIVGMLKYILRTVNFPGGSGEFIQSVTKALSTEMGDELMSMAQQLIKEGRQQGIQEGRQKGIQEGMQRGSKRTFTLLLEKKFRQPIPKKYVLYIEKLSEAEIEGSYLEKVFPANSWEDIFNN